jgi:type I restriction enzyme, S subunit
MSKVQKSATSSQLSKGYKQTEVGSIPEDWNVRPLAYLAEIRSGIAKNSNTFVSNPVLVHYLRVANVQDGFLDLSEMSQLRLNRDDIKRYAVLPGDMLMNEGGDLDKLGRGTLWSGEFNPCVHQNHVFVVRCGSKIVPSYLNSWTSTTAARRYFMLAGRQTTNLASINKSALSQLPVALPPTIEEQEAIAHALSDIDALIESLDRLLTKKRQIKQGAMQELLRSKEGWIAAKLKDVAPLQRGFDLPSSQLQKGIHPVVYSNGIQNYHHEYMVKKPGVTTGRSGTLGVINFIDEDFWPHNTTLWVTDFKGNYPKFIYYLYDHIGFEHFGSGSGVPTLNRNDAHDYLCFIPSKLDEQIEIATILSDMDAEIDSIEAKLTKTRQIKQGMMHELLTGRIRLI